MFGKEPCAPYHRPPLSKAFLAKEEPEEIPYIRPEKFYDQKNVSLRLNETVTAIDPSEQRIRTDRGDISYEHLVLATGSRARKPPLEGVDLPECLLLRTLADARHLREEAESMQSLLVIGAGFIGLEVAASLRNRGVDVTVLEMADRVMARVVGPGISTYFESLHKERGVSLHTGVTVEKLEKQDGTMVVTTTDGTTFRADRVLVGAGAVPETRLAEAAGLDVENGVKVDEFNRTSDPNIYAIGDCCCQYYAPTGRMLRLESVQNALDQAKTVAAVLTGHPSPHDALPWFWSDQYEFKLQIAGISLSDDEIVERGRPTPGEPYSAWYFRDGMLRAVGAVNDSKAYVAGSKLLRQGLQPRPEDIQNTELDTKELAASAGKA